ncbi:MAG: polysaccharide biosynthesis C-terminal domain-containing protein, partial [Nitrososphaerota archaeon]|nr:polysaccharide biosynthesis C-terminal domain-containing protein [Nitrososphaerota archaeon]
PLVHTLFPKESLFSINGILNTLFTINTEPKFPHAPTFLALSSIVNLFVLFGSVSIIAFQTGIGKTKQVMKQSLLSLAISLPFSYGLITYLGTHGGANNESLVIIGGIIAILISTIPGMTWGLIWAWKNYHIKADFKNSAKIFTASLIASTITYTYFTTLSNTLPHAILLFTGATIFLLTYLTTAPLIGAVNHTDINNLKQMSQGIGIITKIINIPLTLMQKLTKKPKTNNQQQQNNQT